MKVEYISFDDVPQFSARDKAYIQNDERLKPFYKYKVSIEAFGEVIKDRESFQVNRPLLVDILTEQYQKFEPSTVVSQNIAALAAPTTFTIITAHQPSLCTGPLYYIYKIISTINLTKQLNERYANYNFVPVFISGGEDHDFEEVNHFKLFGQNIEWQSGEKGSVGRMSTSKLKPIIELVKEKLGENKNANFLKSLLDNSYLKFDNYSDATINLVNELFKDYGLVALNMDRVELKSAFKPILEKELFQPISEETVLSTQKKLEAVGFKSQATPRPINLFYLDDQIRERIVRSGDEFKVLNTDLSFSANELRELLTSNPEKFSPNVIMRPLYQETILPNLAYIGGGGELAYWLERKAQFEKLNVFFPMLIRRDSVLWVDQGSAKKIKKLGLTYSNFFNDTNEITKSFILENSDHELNFDQEITKLETVFEEISNKIKTIDMTLEKRSNADQARFLKSLKELQVKLVKAEKNKDEVAIGQITKLADKLFPSKSLQERKDNFIGLYLKYGNRFFEVLFESLDPLRKKMVVVLDEES